MPAVGISELSPSRRIGVATVTPISDGIIPINPSLLPKATPEEVAPLLERAGLANGPVPASVNAFVIDLPGQRVLIDAGIGPNRVETAGALRENLAIAGITRASIDLILLTHLHRDHVGGLADAQGEAVFPNAHVMLHERDLAFWTDEGEEARAPGFAKQYFSIARASLKPYAARMTTFDRSGSLLAGIEAIHAPGHTPGHTMYRISSEGQSLLIAADIVHIPALQLPRPDWSIVLDVDPDEAARTRKRVLDAAARDGTLLTGMHFVDGAIGRVRAQGEGFFFDAI
ncbi:MBL fold metallo-hydrolase [Microbacteriaceae bacterium K1510]|nr:MBL fold metallo-hydrolase [Microbacteriaceae bacterium K1510]